MLATGRPEEASSQHHWFNRSSDVQCAYFRPRAWYTRNYLVMMLAVVM